MFQVQGVPYFDVKLTTIYYRFRLREHAQFSCKINLMHTMNKNNYFFYFDANKTILKCDFSTVGKLINYVILWILHPCQMT